LYTHHTREKTEEVENKYCTNIIQEKAAEVEFSMASGAQAVYSA